MATHQAQAATVDRSPIPRRSPPPGGLAIPLLLAVFAALLASFPARNADLWGHLAAGRRLAAGQVAEAGPTWLYDLVCYAVFEAGGGVGLVAAKAAVAAGLGVVLALSARAAGGAVLPAVCAALAVLATGTRLLLQPATVSYFLLALAVWATARPGREPARGTGWWPGWGLVALFAVWAGVDRWVGLGLGTLALVWLGRGLDGGSGYSLLARVGSVAVLAVPLAISVALTGPSLPAELAGPRAVVSPFSRGYLTALGSSPAALAYYPLLGLGAVSFLLSRSGRRWERFLPWAGLAVLSGFEARAVPFFAVVGGPVLAWNLHDYFARRADREGVRRLVRAAGWVLGGGLAAAFLAAAWTGWLQGPPFGPRRWAVEPPVAMTEAAAAVRRLGAAGGFPAGTRTLHLTAETAAVFRWACPEDEGVVDGAVTAALTGAGGPAADDLEGRLRVLGVARLVLHVGDRGPGLTALGGLLARPDRWPLLHQSAGGVVFGYRPSAESPPAGRAIDLTRLGLRPAEDATAPAAGPSPRPAGRRWWEAFWRPAPERSPDRDEAAVLLQAANVLLQTAPPRQQAGWLAGQAAGLVGGAAAWGGPVLPDAAVRLALIRPPAAGDGSPPPPVTRYAVATYRRSAALQGDAPPGVLYAAVRAARRAVAADPTDAAAYLRLAQGYLLLLETAAERGWALQYPQLRRLRQVQASFALNRAVDLNPDLAEAHLLLGRLYQRVGCLDLALTHLRAASAAADPGRPAGAGGAEVAELAEAVEARTREFSDEAAQTRVADRAAIAARRGLGGRARDLLLASDVSAFGPQGTQLELDLLLATGRVADVLDWATPELAGAVGTAQYQWVRTQALAAAGEYGAVDADLASAVPADLPAEQADAAAGFARLTGRALLDERPAGGSLADLVWRALGRADYRAAAGSVTQGLTERADIATLRGLLALEAGEADQARAAFRAALAFSPNMPFGGGLGFNGRQLAWDALRLLDAAAGR